MNTSSAAARLHRLWPLLLVLGAGTFFRLYHVEAPAFRADTILFYNLTRHVDGAMTMFSQWLQLMGISAQLPFPMAATEFFLNLFGLETTHFTVRLPSVLWGVGALLAAWCFGKRLGGQGTAFALSLIAAFSPYLILTSREAYFYPPMVLGSFLLPLAATDALKAVFTRDASIPGWRIAAHVAGMFLMIYSQPSGWFAALLLAGISAGATLLQAMRHPEARARAGVLMGASVLVGLPVLFSDWGVPQLMKSSSEEMRSWARRVFEGGPSLPKMLLTSGTAFFMGKGLLRGIVTAACVSGGLWMLVRCARREPWLWLSPVVLLCGMASFLLGREATGAGFYSRYMLAYMPLYLAIIVLGLRGLAETVRRWPADRVLIGAALAIAALNAHPAWLCTQLSGKPTPYKDMAAWLDRELPAGTLVVVDRWLEPWNEMALYQPTNVTVTFTVPDEPYDTFLANRWRDSVLQFFEKFPDAAYMEIARNYWDRPASGRWEWPLRHFARSAVITNTAGLKLREYGLANREDYFAATTNRLLVNIFYNTTDDVIAKARSVGKETLVLYGPDWGYAKPWRETQRFDDYRVLRKSSTLRVFNLTDGAMERRLRVLAVGVGGPKLVNLAGGVVREFPQNQLVAAESTPLTLAPGENRIVLRDVGGAGNAALFVSTAELVAD